MAATTLIRIDSGATTKARPRLMGTGAPANGDVLVTDVTKYGKGSTYYDSTNNRGYIRIGTAGTAADWYCETLGEVQTPAYAATIAVTFAKPKTVANFAQLTGAATVNATVTGFPMNAEVTMTFTNDANTRVVTWGTNIKGAASTLSVTASKKAVARFIFDGTDLVMISSSVTA